MLAKVVWYVSKYTAPPGETNSASRAFSLLKALVSLGYSPVLITSTSNHFATPPKFDGTYEFEKLDGVEICWVSGIPYNHTKSLRRILSWIEFEWKLFLFPRRKLPAPDAIIVSSLSPLTIIVGLYWRWRCKCRLIFEVRDIWPLTLTEEGSFHRFNPLVMLLGAVEKLGYRYADKVVGTMPNLDEHIQNVIGRSRKASCIPMGINTEDIVATEITRPRATPLVIPKGKFVVGYVGSIGHTNALDWLFEVAEEMQCYTSIHFLIVGDGDLRCHYTRTYGHLANITFHPRVKKRNVPQLLAQCNVLYFSTYRSSVWQFGQSLNKIIDYMLSGKPIIGSYSGYPSMINEAGCGQFVPAENVPALKHAILLNSNMPKHELEAMGARGKAWLSAERQYGTLAKRYAKILFDES